MLAGVPGLDPARLAAALGDGGGAGPIVTDLLVRQGERALPELFRALGSGQDDLRDGAVTALTGMGPVAWPGLVVRLRDPSPRVRRGAARALEGTGWTPADVREAFAFRSALGDWDAVAGMGSAAVPFLAEALADPDPRMREEASRALGRCGDPEAVRPLLALLERDPEEEVREASAVALGRLGDRRGVPALRGALSDGSCSVRLAAATALEGVGWRPEGDDETAALLVATQQWPALVGLGAAAVPGLVRALGDDYYGVRREAGESLLALGAISRPALERARRGENPTVRDEAAALLARMPPGPAGADEEGIPIAPHPMAEAGAAGEETAACTVAAAMDAAAEPEEPPAAFAQTDGAVEPGALGPLAGALYAGSPAERLAAAGALASMPPDRAVPALAGALLDSDPTLRKAAAVSLGTLATPGAMRLLVDRLGDPDQDVYGAALEALARAGPTALPALVSALGRPQRQIRTAAAGLLAHAGLAEGSDRGGIDLALGLEDWHGLARFGQDAVEPLAALLVHPDPDLRLGAVIALGRIGGERAGELVRQACADPSPAVRNRAALALHLR